MVDNLKIRGPQEIGEEALETAMSGLSSDLMHAFTDPDGRRQQTFSFEAGSYSKESVNWLEQLKSKMAEYAEKGLSHLKNFVRQMRLQMEREYEAARAKQSEDPRAFRQAEARYRLLKGMDESVRGAGDGKTEKAEVADDDRGLLGKEGLKDAKDQITVLKMRMKHTIGSLLGIKSWMEPYAQYLRGRKALQAQQREQAQARRDRQAQAQRTNDETPNVDAAALDGARPLDAAALETAQAPEGAAGDVPVAAGDLSEHASSDQAASDETSDTPAATTENLEGPTAAAEDEALPPPPNIANARAKRAAKKVGTKPRPQPADDESGESAVEDMADAA